MVRSLDGDDGEWGEWIEIKDEDYIADIQIVNAYRRNGDISSTLSVSKIRRRNAGYCYDPDDVATHLFQPNGIYRFRVFARLPLSEGDRDEVVSAASDERLLETGRLPSNGNCNIRDREQLLPLERFFLDCYDWEADGGFLSYNALITDIPMSQTPNGTAKFEPSASDLSSTTPVGTLAITVLIQDYFGVIECFKIEAEFRTVVEVLADTSNNVTVDSLVENIEDIIEDVDLGEDLSVAASLTTVATELFESGNVERKKQL